MPLAVSPCVDGAQNALSQDKWPAAQSYASDSKSVSSLCRCSLHHRSEELLGNHHTGIQPRKRTARAQQVALCPEPVTRKAIKLVSSFVLSTSSGKCYALGSLVAAGRRGRNLKSSPHLPVAVRAPWVRPPSRIDIHDLHPTETGLSSCCCCLDGLCY
jgi:hypothetical protein